MKLSTKGRYGLRAVIDLAVYSGEKPVSLSSISKRQEISVSYLEQLVPKLKKAGIVESVRGVNGGYRLAKSPEEISVGQILRALEGDISPVDCPGISGEQFCNGSENCVTKLVWKKINDSINDTVDQIYLGELVTKARESIKKENSSLYHCET